MYKVELKPKAQKFIKAQSKKIQRQLIKRIEALADNPRPPNYKALHTKKSIYRIRSGDFRIIYQIKDKVLLVIVTRVANRKDAYKGKL